MFHALPVGCKHVPVGGGVWNRLYKGGRGDEFKADMDVGWSIFWSIAAMPIGLFICFFPFVLAWAGMKEEREEAPIEKRRK